MWPFTRKESDYQRGLRMGAACAKEQIKTHVDSIVKSLVEAERKSFVVAERVACARVADDIAEYGSVDGDTHGPTARLIAQKIRERK